MTSLLSATKLEATKESYVRGYVGLDEFMRTVDRLLASNEADEPAYPGHTPPPSDYRSDVLRR